MFCKLGDVYFIKNNHNKVNNFQAICQETSVVKIKKKNTEILDTTISCSNAQRRVLNPVKQLGWSFFIKTSKTVNYFGKKALSQIFDTALKTPIVLMVNNSDKSDLGQ